MFAKGYTNIRAMIETQYGILSQTVTDIAYRYQAQLKGIEEEADRFARENSNGDYNIYRTILNNFNDVEERQSCLIILFDTVSISVSEAASPQAHLLKH